MFCQDPRISWKTKVSEALGWPYQLLGTGPDQLLLTQPFPLPSYLCTVASMHNNLSWGHQTVSLHPPIWTHLGCCSTLSTGNMYTGLHPPPFIPHLSPKAILPSPPFPLKNVHSPQWTLAFTKTQNTSDYKHLLSPPSKLLSKAKTSSLTITLGKRGGANPRTYTPILRPVNCLTIAVPLIHCLTLSTILQR